MTEEIKQVIAEHDWPGWATHVVRAEYDPERRELNTKYDYGVYISRRPVKDAAALPDGSYHLGSGAWLIPVDLEGRSPDEDGDYRLELVGGHPQHVRSSDVVPIIRGKVPVEGVPVDVLTSVLFGLDETAGNMTEAELLKVYQFAKDFERFFKKP